MKIIKNFILILFLVIPVDLVAQEYSQELKGGKDLTVKFENVIANLTIEGGSTNLITIKATGLKPPPSKAEGLTALKRTGLDNTGLALSIHEYDNMVIISGGSDEENLSYHINLPEDVNLSIMNNDFFKPKNVIINSMLGEIQVGNYFGDVDMIDVSGPIVANINNGELTVTFSEMNQESPMSLISSMSDIDITIPSGSNATFSLAASDGEIYTDLDLEKIEEEFDEIEAGNFRVYSKTLEKFVKPDPQPNFKYRVARNLFSEGSDSLYFSAPVNNYSFSNLLYSSYFGGYDYKGTLNGGGVEITIRTQNGNLYLRKAKR